MFIRMVPDGILGMTITDMSKDGTTPVFNNMVDQGVVDAPIFSFWLNRYSLVVLDVKNSKITAHRKKTSTIFGLFRKSKTGALILGGSDPSLYEGDVTYIDLIKPHWYRIHMDG